MYGLRGKGIKNKDWFVGYYELLFYYMLYGGNVIYFKLIKWCFDLQLYGYVVIYFIKNIQSINVLYCDCLCEVFVFLEFFFIKFLKEYLKFYIL